MIVLLASTWIAYAPVVQPDQIIYLQRWHEAIHASDGLSVFATPFTNYTGGYVTVLWLCGFLAPVLPAYLIIKLAALVGTTLCGGAVFAILGVAGWHGRARANAGLLFALWPTVALNGAGWAQADAFYAAFALYALAAIWAGKPVSGAVFFTVALSFKLQAILIAPVLAGMLLHRPRAILAGILALLPVYLGVNILFLLAGRPLDEVLTIYAGQAGTFDKLSMNAGNLWWLVDLAASEWVAPHYTALMMAGIAATVAAGLVLMCAAWRAGTGLAAGLPLAAACGMLMPFLLPKMHDRYFFMGEVLLLVCALIDGRYFRPALFAQASALCMYSIHHDSIGLRALFGHPNVGAIGVGLMLVAQADLFAKIKADPILKIKTA